MPTGNSNSGLPILGYRLADSESVSGADGLPLCGSASLQRTILNPTDIASLSSLTRTESSAGSMPRSRLCKAPIAGGDIDLM